LQFILLIRIATFALLKTTEARFAIMEWGPRKDRLYLTALL
jgi:hypothetical protein